MMEHLSSEPVRRGDVFCAPFCGRKCTWEEYRTAHRAGAEGRLDQGRPEAWNIRIWENLGWHWELLSKDGCWSMNKVDDEWRANLLTPAEGGRNACYWRGSYDKDPSQAMITQFTHVCDDLAPQLAAMKAAGESLAYP